MGLSGRGIVSHRQGRRNRSPIGAIESKSTVALLLDFYLSFSLARCGYDMVSSCKWTMWYLSCQSWLGTPAYFAGRSDSTSTRAALPPTKRSLR